MNLWNIKKLKDDLSNQKVNQRDLLVYYFLFGLLLTIALLPIDSQLYDYQVEKYNWIDWGVTSFITLITIFLCFKANKGSMGKNFLERIFSIDIILTIRYLVFFDIPIFIFHSIFLEETAYSDIGNLIFTIISYLIVSIRSIQCMKDIQKI
jgi:membrane protease YdiL (CAAX protease family)